MFIDIATCNHNVGDFKQRAVLWMREFVEVVAGENKHRKPGSTDNFPEFSQRLGLRKGFSACKRYTLNTLGSQDVCCEILDGLQIPTFKGPSIRIPASRTGERATLCPYDKPLSGAVSGATR